MESLLATFIGGAIAGLIYKKNRIPAITAEIMNARVIVLIL
jgi:hypothetical protein